MCCLSLTRTRQRAFRERKERHRAELELRLKIYESQYKYLLAHVIKSQLLSAKGNVPIDGTTTGRGGVEGTPTPDVEPELVYRSHYAAELANSVTEDRPSLMTYVEAWDMVNSHPLVQTGSVQREDIMNVLNLVTEDPSRFIIPTVAVTMLLEDAARAAPQPSGP
jgi:hypothetical protein